MFPGALRPRRRPWRLAGTQGIAAAAAILVVAAIALGAIFWVTRQPGPDPAWQGADDVALLPSAGGPLALAVSWARFGFRFRPQSRPKFRRKFRRGSESRPRPGPGSPSQSHFRLGSRPQSPALALARPNLGVILAQALASAPTRTQATPPATWIQAHRFWTWTRSQYRRLNRAPWC